MRMVLGKQPRINSHCVVCSLCAFQSLNIYYIDKTAEIFVVESMEEECFISVSVGLSAVMFSY